MDFQRFADQATAVAGLWAPKVVGAVAVLVVGWVLAGWLRSFAKSRLKASQLDDIMVERVGVDERAVLETCISQDTRVPPGHPVPEQIDFGDRAANPVQGPYVHEVPVAES